MHWLYIIFFSNFIYLNSSNKATEESIVDMRVLLEDAVDWAQNIGLKMRIKEHRTESDVAAMIPFTLFPSPVPRQMYDEAYAVHEDMALLYFRVAADREFLAQKLSEIAKIDETVKKLYDLWEEVHREGIRQPISLMWIRADYMFHQIEETIDRQQYALKQIEVNFGAAGGFDVQNLTPVHRRTLSHAGFDTSNKFLPDNTPYDTYAQGLFEAWKAYGNPNAIMVMQVYINAGDISHFEQNGVEYQLEELSEGKMKIVRLTIAECYERLRLADDFKLWLDDYEVGVVYYRQGRTINPSRLTDERMEVYRRIERSMAITSTSLGMDLASTKKIQQVLAEPGVLERFFPNPEDKHRIAAIRSTFAEMWALERNDEETNAIVEEAIAHPERFVLKPNRDGGGHNLWEQDIAEKLKEFTPSERSRFILMQRLRPMAIENYFVQNAVDIPKLQRVVTEFGTFGYVLGNQLTSEVFRNHNHGHLMRTKLEQCTESGVCNGAGVYDSPYLF